MRVRVNQGRRADDGFPHTDGSTGRQHDHRDEVEVVRRAVGVDGLDRVRALRP